MRFRTTIGFQIPEKKIENIEVPVYGRGCSDRTWAVQIRDLATT
jgi:hypothetical protein